MGAVFCHVIRIIDFSKEVLLITVRYQLWNGADANFTKIAKVPEKKMIPLIGLFCCERYITKTADAVD